MSHDLCRKLIDNDLSLKINKCSWKKILPCDSAPKIYSEVLNVLFNYRQTVSLNVQACGMSQETLPHVLVKDLACVTNGPIKIMPPIQPRLRLACFLFYLT